MITVYQNVLWPPMTEKKRERKRKGVINIVEALNAVKKNLQEAN